MPRADIYRLQRDDDGGIQFACRLTQKAFLQGYAVCMQTSDPATVADLDKALWNFRRDSFVPHTLSDAAADHPAQITVPAAGEDSQAPQLLVHLGARQGAAPDCGRVAEILVAEDDAGVGRRMEFYRTQGYEVHTHSIPAS